MRSIEAVGQLIKVVVASQTIDQTCRKLGNCIERWHSIVVKVRMNSRWSDWSKKINKGGSCIISSIKESLCMPVILLLMNGLLYLSAVEKPSSSN